ncbi:MAG: CHRD domain-containing protein [Bacteroidetes bacterium]|nr:MAG: CHRD domain-containing protein [Bacteroidota bacterium]
MKKTILSFLLACFLAGGVSAQLTHLIFHAELVGSEQIPAVTTDARGLITLMYSPDRSKVTVTGLLVGMEGDVNGITLHLGKTGEVGAAIVDLMPVLHGPRLYGEVTVPPALLQNLLPDQAYASVSTTVHPGGEIRGQFICETDLEYPNILRGSDVVPASGSSAFGFGGLHFPTGSDDLVYVYLVDGLSGPITEAGLYLGNPGENGTLVYSFTGFYQNLIQDVASLDDLPASFLRDAREGKYYVLVKTANFPDGEVRGQVGFMGYFTAFSPVNPSQAVPPTTSTGFGFSHNKLNPTLDSLTSTVYISTITPTAVELRMGDPGTTGVVLDTLEPAGQPGLYRKTYPLDSDRMTAFIEGRLYLNVPTATKPDGEIRGQLRNSLRKGYAFDLCADQVVPPTASNGIGVAVASVDKADCYLHYKVLYDRIGSNLLDAYVCQANTGMNGDTLYPMPAMKPLIAGENAIAAGHGVAIELEEMYMILRTADYPDGEIRGQIRRGFSCPDVSGVENIRQIRDITVSPVPFTDYLTVRFTSDRSVQGRLILYDMLGAPAVVQMVDIIGGDQTLHMPTIGLIPGVYTLSLEFPGEQRSMFLKKLVRR